MADRISKGQRAYEADLLARPVYHDGTPRRKWDQLDSIARWSWDKSPYPLPCTPLNAGGN